MILGHNNGVLYWDMILRYDTKMCMTVGMIGVGYRGIIQGYDTCL